MIFVTAGTTRGDFRRLFSAVDQLAAAGKLSDVKAQLGHSSYEPQHCCFKRFYTRREMADLVAAAEYVICHGGAATLDECLGLGKKLIVAPRLAAHGEAPDNHQLQIASHLAVAKRVLLVTDMAHLSGRVAEIVYWNPKPTVSRRPSLIAATINDFIDGRKKL